MSTTKPTITIIGAGRLGTALAIALSKKGYPIETLVGRRRPRLRKAAALLDDTPRLLALKEINKVSNLVLLTTPDDQLPLVSDTLSKVQIDSRQPPTVLHTSGAISSDILQPLARRGWRTGSLHPLVSVSDPVPAVELFEGAFWCLEGDRKATTLARTIVQDLRGHSFSIKSTAKPLYHAAAVMTSGNIIALFSVAIDMLVRCGLKRNEAQKTLLPLLQSAVVNLSKTEPAKALTGTFSRGDVATVERHLGALKGKGLERAMALYHLLGHESLKLAEANKLNKATSRQIAKMLDE